MAVAIFVLVMLLVASPSWADTFGSGANSFTIDLVTIGNPGNGVYSVSNPAGSVPYEYRIGKYEIPEDAINKANVIGGLGITIDSRGPNEPATSVTWYEAAKFVNWLNTSTGHAPAYKFVGGNFQLWQPMDAGYNPHNLFRNKLAKYVLPSLDEWFKAAYYDPAAGHYWDYPTGSNNIPDGIDFVGDPTFDAVFYDGGLNPGPNDITDAGILSPNGTVGEGGNVAEWNETAFDRQNNDTAEQRGSPGGAWVSSSTLLAAWNTGTGTTPQFESDRLGFRVASVPEPSSVTLVAITLVCTFAVVIKRIAVLLALP
jgi:hypothetical protein